MVLSAHHKLTPNSSPNLESFTTYNDIQLLIIIVTSLMEGVSFHDFLLRKLVSLPELPFFPPSSGKRHLILQKPR